MGVEGGRRRWSRRGWGRRRSEEVEVGGVGVKGGRRRWK